ncbi:MAG: hypothetical protein IPG80_12790 [Anaerolineales bacterium]|uniref:beta strand repeat-containing protein n=1 Tax=Candidatus Villigracilis vicinus TaxID=3140679 RepID=UPI003135D3A6|nr:hypothetical protein [Anaerolineales bacterium]
MLTIKRTSKFSLAILTVAILTFHALNNVYAQAPAPYSKTTPINGTVIAMPSTSYMLLQWTDAGLAATDRYQYCIDETNNSQCDNNTWITRNAIYSGGPGEFTLVAGHTYYWQVRTKDTQTEADNGVWWSFSIQPALTFSKSSLPNGAIIPLPSTTFQLLQWTGTTKDSTDRYQYCVDETNNSLCDNNTWITRDSLYSGGPSEFSIVPGHTYYWQVRLRDAGTVANDGTWWSFTVQPSSALVKLAPANESIISMPASTYQLLQWSETTKDSTDKYQYCIDEINNSQCDNNAWVTRDSLYSGGPGEITLVEGRTYYWQARLRDAQTYANTGTWWSFTIKSTRPSVVRIVRTSSSPTTGSSVGFAVTFSENVSGIDAADFALTTDLNGASISSVFGSANLYIVTVGTGSGNGTIRLDLTDNDTILNTLNVPLGGAGTGNGSFTTGESYTVDRTVPAITSIIRADANPSSAATVRFTATFNKPVTGVDLADFNLTTSAGATLNSISGSGAVYTITATTGAGNDTLRLNFNDNKTVVDGAGNTTNTGFTSGEAYTIDRASPTVTSITATTQANSASAEFVVNFSETVSGVDTSDFQLSTSNGASISGVSGSGSTYHVSITLKPGSDTIQLNLQDDDSIIDGLGNRLGGQGTGNGNFASGNTAVTVNVPTVTSIVRAGTNPSNAQSVDFIVTFSEPVSGVDQTDFQVTGGTVTAVNNQNPFYIVTVTAGTVDGSLKLDLIDNDSIQNNQNVRLGGTGAGNANFLTGETFTIDRTPPQVTSIVRAGGNPTINPTADFIVTFSESVTGVETNDFIVTQTNAIKSAVLTLQNVNPFYWVTVKTGAGSGTIRLDMLDNGNIVDLAGNKLVNTSFTSGESFTLAKTTVGFGSPAVITPNNTLITNSAASFSWSPVQGAQAYEYFIARDSAFFQIVSAQTVPESTTQIQIQLTDGMYYFRVRAYNSDLNPGVFSSAISVMVDAAPPSPPKPITPQNNVDAPKRPWLRWSVVSDAVQYQVEVDNDADFSSPIFSKQTTSTTVQVTNLTRKVYYWRIRAKDAAGNWSGWSDVFRFTIR